MNLEQLKKLPTQDLIDLYNDLTSKQVKRMATRADAERRVTEELKKAGKWVDEVVPPGAGQSAKKNMVETANAGINDGTPLRGAHKGGGKAAGKAPERAKKTAPAAKAGKGTGKEAGAAPGATEKPKRKGAPTKNQTYVAIAPSDKAYNPKGLKMNAGSDRAAVLAYIQANGGKRTRNEVAEHFAKIKEDRNVDSGLYFLSKYGFCRVSE